MMARRRRVARGGVVYHVLNRANGRLGTFKKDGKSVEAVQACIDRGRPFGEAAWVEAAAREMGLGSSLRLRGRPKKEAECVEG